jgi:hypothetical protein
MEEEDDGVGEEAGLLHPKTLQTFYIPARFGRDIFSY